MTTPARRGLLRRRHITTLAGQEQNIAYPLAFRVTAPQRQQAMVVNVSINPALQPAPSSDKKSFTEKYLLPIVLALFAASAPITAAVIVTQNPPKPAVACTAERDAADKRVQTHPDYRLPSTDPAQQVCDINGYLDSIQPLPPAPTE